MCRHAAFDVPPQPRSGPSARDLCRSTRHRPGPMGELCRLDRGPCDERLDLQPARFQSLEDRTDDALPCPGLRLG